MRLLVVAPLVLLFAACACRADVIETNEIDDEDDKVGVDTREKQRPDRPLAEIFENAVQAYLENDWRGCIVGFNEALYRYVLWSLIVGSC